MPIKKKLYEFLNVINYLVCIVIQKGPCIEKLLKLDKRFIGRDEHAYTILSLNHVLKIFE